MLSIDKESTRIAALKAGEVDVINLSRERVTEIEEAGFRVYPRPGQAVIGFYFHQMWEDVPWSDIRVRKAMNIAIDRDEMVEFIFAGRGSPGIVLPNAAVRRSIWRLGPVGTQERPVPL